MLLWLAVFIAGCSSTPQGNFSALPTTQQFVAVGLSNRLQAEWLKPTTNLFTLGPGDRLDIELIGETNSLTETVVCPDGKIYFNVLQGLDVWGLTLGETRVLLEQKLAEQIRSGPKVSVDLRAVESKRIWVLGRVQAPAVYPLDHPTTLLEALSAAGGTSSFVSQRDIPLSTAVEELADLRRSFVVRRGKLLPVDFDRLMNYGDLSQNIYLEPDDFVYLPPATAPEVFVIGAVAQPRSVPYTESLTLAGAVAACYGTVDDAYLSHVAIVRGSLAQPEITVIDYGDVVHGRIRDVDLAPGDIIHVPFSPYRYLEKYVDVILNTFAASVAINAGSSLVLREPAQQAGIIIPVGSRITVQPPLPPVQ
jgi:protein involved in polysaccharide export with SLBB domain